MGIGFAPTWLRQVTPPLLHKTTLTTAYLRSTPQPEGVTKFWEHGAHYRPFVELPSLQVHVTSSRSYMLLYKIDDRVLAGGFIIRRHNALRGIILA